MRISNQWEEIKKFTEDGDLLETLDSRANTKELLLGDGLKEI